MMMRGLCFYERREMRVLVSGFAHHEHLYFDMLETREADSDCVGFTLNHTNNKGKTFTGCSSSSNSSSHITAMTTDSCSASVFD